MTMDGTVQIRDLADAIMDTLEEYSELATKDLKTGGQDAGETVRKEIRTNAPKDTVTMQKAGRRKRLKKVPTVLW